MQLIKSKPKILVLITSAFPYGAGESFLETELPYLIKKFNKIVIFTSAVPHGRGVDINSSIEVFKFSYLWNFSYLLPSFKLIREILIYLFSY